MFVFAAAVLEPFVSVGLLVVLAVELAVSFESRAEAGVPVVDVAGLELAPELTLAEVFARAAAATDSGPPCMPACA